MSLITSLLNFVLKKSYWLQTFGQQSMYEWSSLTYSDHILPMYNTFSEQNIIDRHYTWSHILVCPPEEPTLLITWFPAGVKHSSLVWSIFHDGPGHCRLITVTHSFTIITSRYIAKASWGPGRLRILSQGSSAPSGWCLLSRKISPQEELTVSCVALVELTASIGTLFANSENNGILTTVTHNGTALGWNWWSCCPWRWQSGCWRSNIVHTGWRCWGGSRYMMLIWSRAGMCPRARICLSSSDILRV